jgi:CAAX protease family protein
LAQSVVVELVLGLIGIGLIILTGRSLAEAFTLPAHPILALLGGLAVGAFLGGAFGFGVTRPEVASRVRPFLTRFTSARPTALNFALIGLAAALGEETLFRAAIQPVAGIVVASLLFTLAHSLIADFRHPTPGKLAYAALAFGMGILLGVLYDQLGIAASMGAHFAFDTTALLLIRPLLPARVPVSAAV